jgi:hypothetical protein
MVNILVGFLVDGDDMSIAAVSGLDMGSSRFVVHGRLHQMASLIEEKTRRARPACDITTHILQWGTTLWALGLDTLPWT